MKKEDWKPGKVFSNGAGRFRVVAEGARDRFAYTVVRWTNQSQGELVRVEPSWITSPDQYRPCSCAKFASVAAFCKEEIAGDLADRVRAVARGDADPGPSRRSPSSAADVTMAVLSPEMVDLNKMQERGLIQIVVTDKGRAAIQGELSRAKA